MQSDPSVGGPPRIRLNVDPEPITEDDAVIRAAVEATVPRALLATVAAVTGDYSVLVDMEPDPLRGREPNGGFTEEQVALAADLATNALALNRDAGNPLPVAPTEAQLRRLVEYVAGMAVNDQFFEMIREELGLHGEDRRAPGWHKAEVAPDRDFRVGIIGSGMSGILMAYRLGQAGIAATIFEKTTDVGGTWNDNRYPGCRVDVASNFYSYSFAQTIDWPEFYSQQPVLKAYFDTCVDQFGVRDIIQLDSEITAAAWDDASQQWELTVRKANGDAHTERVHALVSAVGQLNRPILPDITGRGDFAGPMFHSAQWDSSVDLTGKRIGVVGTGASAVQLVPEIAELAEQVTVFQRTPPWIITVPHYRQAIPPGLAWVKRHLPSYQSWDRVFACVRTEEGLLPMTEVEPEWAHSGAVGEMNDVLRQMLAAGYDEEFPDPDLRARSLPSYPPASKRMLPNDGSYASALHRDNVTLQTDPIDVITADGIRTVTPEGSPEDHPCDVLIFATGFGPSGFLMPMKVTGRDGVDLHEMWAGDARAYMGITVPHFPNLFLMYGPNTNIVVNGSIIFFSECEAGYITDALRVLLQEDLASLSVRSDVHDEYNRGIDEANRRRVWGVSPVSTWYLNEHGRSATNWPHNLLPYWEQTRRLNPDDYELVDGSGAQVRSSTGTPSG